MRSRGRGSSTFATGETQTYQEFLVIRNAMRRLFKQSDVAQMKFQEYLAHKAAVAEANKKQSEIKLKAKAEEQDWVIPPVDIAPSEKGPQQNRGPVLDVPTIWCPNWRDGKDEIAPWPTLAEMKWEGDDRAKTGVGRYLPIPREIGAPSIHWNQLAAVEIYPLDRVREVPTMEDVYLPVDEIDDSLKYDLITPDLEEAINASCF
ncbi:hypothetical protein BCR34DRAFT_473116 [Clohesyomyces aquaticus]|uniref:Uncharacterized protein n=1 Tax=Clohesyomyces aquaticus TaxID=1231657 RepID=A0A1Y2A8E2_9PLEO|nr:hypothetical protein BCR34DRAFT_473116 [Clohesyomyces aquaticus]